MGKVTVRETPYRSCSDVGTDSIRTGTAWQIRNTWDNIKMNLYQTSFEAENLNWPSWDQLPVL